MNYIFILIFASFFNSIVFAGTQPLETAAQLLEELTTAKNLKNVEKAQKKDSIINELTNFVSSFIASHQTDTASLDTALAIANNKALFTQKTSPVIAQLVASINDAYSQVKKNETERKREEQKEQQRIEAEQKQKEMERTGKESVQKFLDSVGENDIQVTVQLEGKISNEDAAAIADFFKKHEKISSAELHLDNLSFENAKTILSGLEKQLESLKLVRQGSAAHNFHLGNYLTVFSKLRNLDVSQMPGFFVDFSYLPQTIETLDLRNGLVENLNSKTIAALHKLRTLNLTNANKLQYKGENSPSTIVAITTASIDALKTALQSKVPDLVITP